MSSVPDWEVDEDIDERADPPTRKEGFRPLL
jgi:hypothetical protein